MNSSAEQDLMCSSKLSTILLCSIQEIIGEDGLMAVLKQAEILAVEAVSCRELVQQPLSFEQVCSIQLALEALLGARGGRGVALRSGRVMFQHILREFGSELGFADLVFRLSPTEVKLQMGLEILARILSDHMNFSVKVELGESQFLFTITRCPVCWERVTDVVVCHLIVGMLQEVAYWVSGGKIYIVEEQTCIARDGSACVIVIQKKHLD
jgi:predicted hydrocarbon binding protein